MLPDPPVLCAFIYFFTCINHVLSPLDRTIMDTSSILQLADTIKENASLLHDYLVENDRPNPSLGVDGASLSISHHERDTLNARETLWSATRELQNLILGPIGILFNIGVRAATQLILSSQCPLIQI